MVDLTPLTAGGTGAGGTCGAAGGGGGGIEGRCGAGGVYGVSSGGVGEGSKIKTFMGKTPGILKSKFLSVLGNSNEILTGISNKLDITLSLSSSSDSNDDCDDDEDIPNNNQDDESIDMSTIDFESRRVKERRAHEEILSGKFRHPIPKAIQNGLTLKLVKQPPSIDSDSISKSSSTYSNSIDSKSPNKGDTDLEEELTEVNNGDADGDGIPTPPEINICPAVVVANNVGNGTTTNDTDATTPNAIETDTAGHQKNQNQNQIVTYNNTQKPSNSSTLTSLNDPSCLPSASAESMTDLKIWIRSESSDNSVPSWASSISLDNSHADETIIIKEFMKKYVDILFTNSSSIGLELKSEFGQKARTEAGRLWFSRYVNAQRSKSKRVDETTFYSLVQYFAIILFECAESEDYSPAKNLMNMCFTFYHEIEVPGCEPYREYLFTYLRQQPIWHTLRFWNAAFFDALQSERVHRPVPKIKKNQKFKKDNDIDNKNNLAAIKMAINQNNDIVNDDGGVSNSTLKSSLQVEQKQEEELTRQKNQQQQQQQQMEDEDLVSVNEIKEDQKFQQNITFGQLGTFTCNMHAFGLSKDLCLEFLKKQSLIANLPKEQEKLLRENINRMYLETERWGA